MVRPFFLLLVLLFLFSPTVSFADVTVRIGATPAYPGPNQQVTLTARSSATKGQYLYAWVLNGIDLTSGVDLSSVTVSSGAPGAETMVAVALIDSAGNIVGTDSYAIRPGNVDVLWEGETYTPAFYRGKPYPNGNSQIILQAIPHIVENGAEVPANDLVYTWTVNGVAPEALSGYGKSAVTISPTSFRNTTAVSVTVSTRDGMSAARGFASIPILSPQIVVYEDTPLGGAVLNSAVPATIPFSGDEMTFWAVPFFSVSPQTMTYNWSLNGAPFTLDPQNPSEATFRKVGAGGGTFLVRVSAEQQGHIFENVAKTFNLSFE